MLYCSIERTFRKSSNLLVCSISFHSRTFHWGKLAGLPLHLIDVLPPLSQSETSVRLDFRPIQTTQELGLAGFQFDFWIDLLPIFARLWPPKYYYNCTRLLIPPATQAREHHYPIWPSFDLSNAQNVTTRVHLFGLTNKAT